MSKAVEQLQAARDLLADPARWARNTYARDQYGQAVDPDQPEAVCWCAYGALERVGAGESSEAREYLRAAATDLFEDFPACVNDDRGHAAVLRMYGRAIELAEGRS